MGNIDRETERGKMRGRHRHPALTRCRPRTSRYDAALRSEHPSSRRHGAIGHSRRPESLRETFQASFRIRPHTPRIVESTVSPSSPIYPESPVNPFLAGSHAAGGVLILSFFFLTICSEVNENKETDKANRANDAFFAAGYTINCCFSSALFTHRPPTEFAEKAGVAREYDARH